MSPQVCWRLFLLTAQLLSSVLLRADKISANHWFVDRTGTIRPPYARRFQGESEAGHFPLDK